MTADDDLSHDVTVRVPAGSDTVAGRQWRHVELHVLSLVQSAVKFMNIRRSHLRQQRLVLTMYTCVQRFQDCASAFLLSCEQHVQFFFTPDILSSRRFIIIKIFGHVS